MFTTIDIQRQIESLEAENITIDLTGREYLACEGARSSSLSDMRITLGYTSRLARIVNLKPVELQYGIINYIGTFRLFGKVDYVVFEDK